MDWLDSKYIELLGVRLRNFKKKSANLYNFSCCLCHDSTTDKRKARAYVYVKKGNTLMHCHNCSTTMFFSKFLKTVDPVLYDDMIIERIKDQKPREQLEREQFFEKFRQPLFMTSGPVAGLKKVSQLAPDDPVKRLVDSRKIPNPYHARLFKCTKFFSWTNTVVPGKFSKAAEQRDECRLIIPFIGKDESVHAYQGRSLDKLANIKYIDRKSTRLNSSHIPLSRMPSSA